MADRNLCQETTGFDQALPEFAGLYIKSHFCKFSHSELKLTIGIQQLNSRFLSQSIENGLRYAAENNILNRGSRDKGTKRILMIVYSGLAAIAI